MSEAELGELSTMLKEDLFLHSTSILTLPLLILRQHQVPLVIFLEWLLYPCHFILDRPFYQLQISFFLLISFLSQMSVSLLALTL